MKLIKYIIISFVVITVAGLLVLTLSVNTIVKSSIERVGTEMTGTAVLVDRVSISPFNGSGEISGFRVANPEGYGHDYAIEVNNFSMKLNLWSVFTDEIEIEEIIIESPLIYVEQKLPENNIYTIWQQIRDTAPQETSDAEMVIGYFRMSGATARLYTEVGGEREATIELDPVEISDLGRGGGRQAVEEVVIEIADRIAQQVLNEAASGGLEQLWDSIRGIFD